jgi:excisionase family DNA binding protein
LCQPLRPGTSDRRRITGSTCVPKRTSKAAPNVEFSACDDGLMRPYPEAATFLRVGRSTIFELMAKGALPTIRVFDGGPRRIPKAALVRYLNARVIERA